MILKCVDDCTYNASSPCKVFNLLSVAIISVKNKGKYFGQKRPPGGGGNKFNSRKNREEIQFQKKSKKLTMFMSFMDILSVFDEFLP